MKLSEKLKMAAEGGYNVYERALAEWADEAAKLEKQVEQMGYLFDRALALYEKEREHSIKLAKELGLYK